MDRTMATKKAKQDAFSREDQDGRRSTTISSGADELPPSNAQQHLEQSRIVFSSAAAPDLSRLLQLLQTLERKCDLDLRFKEPTDLINREGDDGKDCAGDENTKLARDDDSDREYWDREYINEEDCSSDEDGVIGRRWTRKGRYVPHYNGIRKKLASVVNIPNVDSSSEDSSWTVYESSSPDSDSDLDRGDEDEACDGDDEGDEEESEKEKEEGESEEEENEESGTSSEEDSSSSSSLFATKYGVRNKNKFVITSKDDESLSEEGEGEVENEKTAASSEDDSSSSFIFYTEYGVHGKNKSGDITTSEDESFSEKGENEGKEANEKIAASSEDDSSSSFNFYTVYGVHGKNKFGDITTSEDDESFSEKGENEGKEVNEKIAASSEDDSSSSFIFYTEYGMHGKNKSGDITTSEDESFSEEGENKAEEENEELLASNGEDSDKDESRGLAEIDRVCRRNNIGHITTSEDDESKGEDFSSMRGI